MDKAKVLKLEEAAEWNQKVIWMEMREVQGAIPVTFYAERAPFLRFNAEDRVLMIEVRADYYRKTWRCWDRDPAGRAGMNLWDSAGGEDDQALDVKMNTGKSSGENAKAQKDAAGSKARKGSAGSKAEQGSGGAAKNSQGKTGGAGK